MSNAQETVVLSGHIIDSLILAKVLDRILMMGGTFDIEEISIGKKREDPSRARIVVRAVQTTDFPTFELSRARLYDTEVQAP